MQEEAILFAEGNLDRMRRVRTIALCGSWLLLPLGCGGNDDGPLGVDEPADPWLVLQPNELCSDHSERYIATFEDANLEAAVIGALGIGAQEDLTCGLISELEVLVGPNGPFMYQEIESLVGVQNLTGLTSLTLSDHSISDISVLSGLTRLTHLDLWVNSISDISALSALTGLTYLDLTGNSITDIGALSGLTNLKELVLGSNSITDIGALSGLASLTALRLWNNSISDISGLSGLTGLTTLDLRLNSISDISALSGLTSLTVLTLYNNSISDISALSGLKDLGDVEGAFFRAGPDLNLKQQPQPQHHPTSARQHRARGGRHRQPLRRRSGDALCGRGPSASQGSDGDLQRLYLSKPLPWTRRGAEESLAGQSFETTMTSYSGTLME